MMSIYEISVPAVLDGSADDLSKTHILLFVFIKFFFLHTQPMLDTIGQFHAIYDFSMATALKPIPKDVRAYMQCMIGSAQLFSLY